MAVKDLRKSRFLHEMCEGLHVKLTVYRRGTDERLFKWYTRLYEWADTQDMDIVDQLMDQTQTRYPLRDEEIDLYLVMSHRWRVKINHAENKKLAARQERTLFLKSPGEMPGVMMQPQDMHIWAGMELLCQRRKYMDKAPVNGGVYVVHSWTKNTIWVRLHEDYRQEFDADPDSDESSDEDDEVPTLNPEWRPALRPDQQGWKGWYTMTHAEAARVFRPQHALVYASIQGRTMREKHIALLDTTNKNFNVRYMIVAISRATHGKYVHVPTKAQEAAVKQNADAMATARPPQEPPQDSNSRPFVIRRPARV